MLLTLALVGVLSPSSGAASGSGVWTIRNIGVGLPKSLVGADLNPVAINAHGEVIGDVIWARFCNYNPPNESPPGCRTKTLFRAFVWADGKLTLLRGGAAVSAIDDQGVIAGEPISAPGRAVAVLWRSPQANPVRLGTLGGSSSSATAINHRGQIAGSSKTANGEEHAFLWQNGKMRDLGTLGGHHSEADGINAEGYVFGTSTTAHGVLDGFVWHDGRMLDLGSQTMPTAINDTGTVVGAKTDTYGNPRWSFSWRNGKMRRLPVATTLIPKAVNNKGDILLQAYTGRGAYLLVGRKEIPITSPGISVASAMNLDNLGQVIGTCFTKNGARRSYLWQDGQAKLLPTFDGAQPPWDSPAALDDHGEIVGTSYVTDHATTVLWKRRDSPAATGTRRLGAPVLRRR